MSCVSELLPESVGIPTVVPGMTLVTGLPGKDCCVVVADSRALLSDHTKRDREKKILQIGGNCVVGLSDEADVSLRILKETGWLQRRDLVDAFSEAENIARALRLYRLGNTSISGWWNQPCSQEEALRKSWNKPPYLGGMIVGFSGLQLQNPTVVSISQMAAYACHSSDHPRSIGITYWANAILNEHFPQKPELRTEANLVYLGILCLAATSRFTSVVNNAPRVVIVRRDQVEELAEDTMRPYIERAEKALCGWFSAIEDQMGRANNSEA